MAEKKSHHAHRLCRLLIKAAVANEIGPEVCWMLTVIAHTEDARHYAGPVTFWRDQFMVVCGCRSVGRMMRIRQRAVDAGWLIYENGGNHHPSKYLTTIPPAYRYLPDTPTDEYPAEPDSSSSVMEPKTQSKRIPSEFETQSKRNRSGTPSTLTLTPTPNPKKKAAVADLSFDAVMAELSDEDRALSSKLDCPQFRDAWALWLKYRKELKSKGKMTPTTANRQIKMFAKVGPTDAVAMIEHTISMGWLGPRAPETKGHTDSQKGFL